MQMDKTRIVIRQRSWSEILDLALHVCRSQAGGLLAAMLAGAVPMALINYALTRGMLRDVEYQGEWPWDYVWSNVLLAMLEAPLVTAPATLYLGQSLFEEIAGARRIARDFVSSLPQLLLFQGLLRTLLVVPIVTAIMPFAMWPYANEIILLERNPLVARRAGTLSARRRSAALHSGMSGELFIQSVGAFCLGAMLVVMFLLTIWFFYAMFSGDWEFGWWVFAIGLPATIWTVVGYLVVVRFLSYLDLRIRREGWDVDLALRAQRARLLRQVSA